MFTQLSYQVFAFMFVLFSELKYHSILFMDQNMTLYLQLPVDDVVCVRFGRLEFLENFRRL